MGENIQLGLMLLAIGLPTVFFILLLVIALGKGLIWAVNKYAPEVLPKVSDTIIASEPNQQEISQTKISAIVSAVGMVTGGKGKVVKIEKQ